MANTLTGRIFAINPIEELTTKNGKAFQKRTLILDCSRYDQNTGTKYENTPKLEFVGKNATLPDTFNIGDLVTIHIDISGRIYEKNGVQNVFNSIVGYKIEAIGQQQSQADIALLQAVQGQQMNATQSQDPLPF